MSARSTPLRPVDVAFAGTLALSVAVFTRALRPLGDIAVAAFDNSDMKTMSIAKVAIFILGAMVLWVKAEDVARALSGSHDEIDPPTAHHISAAVIRTGGIILAALQVFGIIGTFIQAFGPSPLPLTGHALGSRLLEGAPYVAKALLGVWLYVQADAVAHRRAFKSTLPGEVPE